MCSYFWIEENLAVLEGTIEENEKKTFYKKRYSLDIHLYVPAVPRKLDTALLKRSPLFFGKNREKNKKGGGLDGGSSLTHICGRGSSRTSSIIPTQSEINISNNEALRCTQYTKHFELEYHTEAVYQMRLRLGEGDGHTREDTHYGVHHA